MKKYSSLIVAAGIITGLVLAAPAFAQTSQNSGTQPGGNWMGRGMGRTMYMMPGVFGTVSAINGTTLTLMRRMGPKSGTATTYTVDATNATVTKNGATSTLASVAVGDNVFAQGTLNGTSVTATAIRDGFGPIRKGNEANDGKGGQQRLSMFQGNGQPIIGGNVSAMNGMSLTVTNKSNVVYTVDATNATVLKNGATSTITNVAVGDNLVVQGTVNGTSITASSIIDSGTVPAVVPGTPKPPQTHMGIFGAIGNFFSRLFGF